MRALLIVALLCGSALAEDDDVELGKAHFKTGEIYFERGMYRDAAREFEEAFRLSRRVPLLYNAGKSYDMAGDAVRALDSYRRFLLNAGNSPDKPEVLKRVDHLNRVVGRLTVTSTVPESTVQIDGHAVGTTPGSARSIEVNPGWHTVAVAHEGYSTWHGSVNVSSGTSATVHAQPLSLMQVVRVESTKETPPKKQPIYKKWWFWTAIGGAVVAGGVVTAAVLATGSDDDGPSAMLPAVR